ncbi:zinc ribbon domain-containing protein [Candidatus Saganbacteria bacterium]|nr:zinc ribbon domain-containing protein [Candidatus Saganbacteria bacterium]
MPLYDYKCEKCGHIFEVMQKITAEPLKFCPECKGPIKRLISAVGIIFKGSGFHVTDYANKAPEKKSAGKPGESEKTDKPATETKTETKPETKPSTTKNS